MPALSASKIGLDILNIISGRSLLYKRTNNGPITQPCEVSVILVIFHWNLNFLDRFSKNTQITNFTQNPSSGSRVVPCRQVNGQTWWSYSCFSQFCKHA